MSFVWSGPQSHRRATWNWNDDGALAAAAACVQLDVGVEPLDQGDPELQALAWLGHIQTHSLPALPEGYEFNLRREVNESKPLVPNTAAASGEVEEVEVAAANPRLIQHFLCVLQWDVVYHRSSDWQTFHLFSAWILSRVRVLLTVERWCDA